MTATSGTPADDAVRGEVEVQHTVRLALRGDGITVLRAVLKEADPERIAQASGVAFSRVMQLLNDLDAVCKGAEA